jgi:hypothetical protein
MEKRMVGSSTGLWKVGDWTLWKVLPQLKQKKELHTAQEPETLGHRRHSEVFVPPKKKRGKMVHYREPFGTRDLKGGAAGANVE